MKLKNSYLFSILVLSKIKITVSVALSCMLGFFLKNPTLNMTAFYGTIGVLLLASSAGILNQYQDRKYDARLQRTKERPIPSGKISSKQALIIAGILFCIGSIILMQIDRWSLLLGWACCFWYNGLYTPCKKYTGWVAILGAVIGALPPWIGWVGAGGTFENARPIWETSAFFFLWQIPHAWLLLLKDRDDYEQIAEIPYLTKQYSPLTISIFIGIFLVILACFPIFICQNHIRNIFFSITILFFSFVLLTFALRLIQNPQPYIARITFIVLNIYGLWIMIVLAMIHARGH